MILMEYIFTYKFLKKILSFYLIDLCHILNLSKVPKNLLINQVLIYRVYIVEWNRWRRDNFVDHFSKNYAAYPISTQNNETISFLQVLRLHYWFTKKNPFVHNYRSELKKKQKKPKTNWTICDLESRFWSV